MQRRAILLLVTVGLGGCGDGSGTGAEVPERPAAAPPVQPTAEPGFDPLDPRYDVLSESPAAEEAMLARAGRRRDLRVPASLLRGLEPGPLVNAATLRVWNEVEPGDPRYHRLNAGQRAVLALLWADAEILNGGFDQFWFNSSGYFAADLVAAARRVGAREYRELFAEAASLFPGGRIPRVRGARQRLLDDLDAAAVARLDDRYAEFQYRRSTALGVILGRYVRRHLQEFAAAG